MNFGATTISILGLIFVLVIVAVVARQGQKVSTMLTTIGSGLSSIIKAAVSPGK